MANLVPCECGAHVPYSDGATHRYIGAVAGCWAIYGEVLAREYENAMYMRFHHFTVDAYSLQHPGTPSPQAIQSVAVHLVSLYHQLELNSDIDTMRDAMRRITQRKGQLPWLEPPTSFGEITVLDIHAAATAEEHGQLVQQWATSVWEAWSAHHPIVREWATT